MSYNADDWYFFLFFKSGLFKTLNLKKILRLYCLSFPYQMEQYVSSKVKYNTINKNNKRILVIIIAKVHLLTQPCIFSCQDFFLKKNQKIEHASQQQLKHSVKKKTYGAAIFQCQDLNKNKKKSGKLLSRQQNLKSPCWALHLSTKKKNLVGPTYQSI